MKMLQIKYVTAIEVKIVDVIVISFFRIIGIFLSQKSTGFNYRDYLSKLCDSLHLASAITWSKVISALKHFLSLTFSLVRLRVRFRSCLTGQKISFVHTPFSSHRNSAKKIKKDPYHEKWIMNSFFNFLLCHGFILLNIRFDPVHQPDFRVCAASVCIIGILYFSSILILCAT